MLCKEKTNSVSETSTERKLAEIWREIFNIKEVNSDSNFFDLGGTSITIIKFLSRIENVFGKEVLSPQAIFDDARLGYLASIIDETFPDISS